VGVYGLASWAENKNTLNFRYPMGYLWVEKILIPISALVRVSSHPQVKTLACAHPGEVGYSVCTQ
jgi:hypothetical protein